MWRVAKGVGRRKVLQDQGRHEAKKHQGRRELQQDQGRRGKQQDWIIAEVQKEPHIVHNAKGSRDGGDQALAAHARTAAAGAFSSNTVRAQ